MPDQLILIVDDHWELRRSVPMALVEAGYRVAAASDGATALRMLREGLAPDLILVDLRMPVMSGWELRNALLKDPALSQIPLIATSGHPENLGDDIGFEVLPKPLELDVLLDRIRARLAAS